MNKGATILSISWRIMFVGWLLVTFSGQTYGHATLADSADATVYFPLVDVPGFISGAQIANLEAVEAAVTITVYKSDGTVDGTPLSATIPANWSKTFFPISNITAGSGKSVKISSSRKVVGIGNILSADFRTGASYNSPTAATSVRLPLLSKNNSGFSSLFGVQNGGDTAATVTVDYSDGTTATAVVPANTIHLFDQDSETHTQNVFSAVVDSDVPVAVAVLLKSTKVTSAYTAFTNGSTNPVFPLVNANNHSYLTGIQLQNIGTTATTVTVTYTPSSAGTACTETRTINPSASATFALAAFANGDSSTCTAGERFVGSARVTANSAAQPLVGIANQLLPGVNGEAYGSFNPDEVTSSVAMPLIMDRNSGFYTGFSLQNVGTASTAVTCTFTNSSVTLSATLDPGAALTDVQADKLADKYVGSATCTGSSGAKLVAIVNELGPNSTIDQLLVYEAFARQ